MSSLCWKEKRMKEIEVIEITRPRMEAKIVLSNGDEIEFVIGPNYWECDESSDALVKTEEFIDEVSDMFADWSLVSGEVDERLLEEGE
jgi:hypothetical protein